MILKQDALRAIPNNSQGKYIKIIHVTAKYWSKIYNSLLLSHFGFICRLKVRPSLHCTIIIIMELQQNAFLKLSMLKINGIIESEKCQLSNSFLMSEVLYTIDNINFIIFGYFTARASSPGRGDVSNSCFVCKT